MVVAQRPFAQPLMGKAKAFLQAVEQKDLDTIWNEMATFEAVEVISYVAWPIFSYDHRALDTFFKTSTIDGMAYGFQKDFEGIRTRILDDLITDMANAYLPDYSENEGEVYTRSNRQAAVYAQPGAQRDVVIPFVRDEDGEYKIDLLGLFVFSRWLSAEKVYSIGMESLRRDRTVEARRFFDVCGRLQSTYDRLRDLWWEHSLVGGAITGTRRTELAGDYDYVLLGLEQSEIIKTSGGSGPIMNLQDFMFEVFQGYTEIGQVEVTPDDMRQLSDLPEGELRVKVASLLSGVDPVVAEREATKKHTGYEISDLDIVVTYKGRELNLSMPFKSGKEYRAGQSVPVDVLNQVLRPHLHFSRGKCVVVLITVHPCSEPLHRDILLHRDRFGAATEIIQAEQLCKLLKVNRLLR